MLISAKKKNYIVSFAVRFLNLITIYVQNINSPRIAVPYA
jgi:hypothetical protein